MRQGHGGYGMPRGQLPLHQSQMSQLAGFKECVCFMTCIRQYQYDQASIAGNALTLQKAGLGGME